LKFLHLVEIENFTKNEEEIKKLIFDRLKTKILKKKVTSVFIDVELNKDKLKKIRNL
jgi:hypothetical protein